MIAAKGITKRYPGVTALEGVSLSIQRGEVVGLIGENGAGKSTLIKVLGGLASPDEGTLEVAGSEVRLHSASDATRAGIGVIHQELNNLDNLDVASNVFLGREPRQFGFLLDQAEARRRTVGFLERVGLNIPPETPLRELSIAQQQMVEIAKALSQEARILIMDEPTSSLTAAETEILMEVVRELRAQNVGVVYVSHRLNEVMEIADRVVALRDGRNAGALTRDEMSPDAMVRLMVGRDLEHTDVRPYVPRPPHLRVEGLRTRRYPQHPVSFHVGQGEIVGMAGLVGAGRSEVARAIFGVDGRVAGAVTLNDRAIAPHSPASAIQSGLFLAPEDRRKEGLVTAMAIRENVTLPNLPSYATKSWIHRGKETTVANDMRDRLRIKAPTVESEVRGLSGGNQQKVVLAKWLAMAPQCMVFDEPTRGIDIGARAEIYALMRSLAAEGCAILMISSDMEEVLALSDRVLVMQEGKLMGDISREHATQESIMEMAVRRG